MSKIVLCDIDGTVANNDHRQHLLTNYKDWDKFFSKLSEDSPIFPIIEIINQRFRDGMEIYFVTGRPERFRTETMSWLEKYFKYDFLLIMRKDNDVRNKLTIKKEMLRSIEKEDEVIEVYENDLDLIEMWEELEIKTININKFI